MRLIGRTVERRRMEMLIRAGRHVLLEGPVGTGKTTLAGVVAGDLGRPVFRVDGDGRYTEQKLVGSFDPKLVLDRGFVLDSFLPGPLFRAMQEGGILLINELNRMPEMVQNVLLPALDEGLLQIPVLGAIRARPGFVLIATQNPREFVGTSALSEALLDRLEWIGLSSMTEEEECQIVQEHVSGTGPIPLLVDCVSLIRMTRSHAKVKRGASVRAAMTLAGIVRDARIESLDDPEFLAAAKSVLANRIELQSGKFSNLPYSEILDELLLELIEGLKKKS